LLRLRRSAAVDVGHLRRKYRETHEQPRRPQALWRAA
jgi:hypothetical protein